MIEVHGSYTWVVGLKNGDFDALILEVALALSEVERSMVWSGMPWLLVEVMGSGTTTHQLVKKVILSVDILDGNYTKVGELGGSV